MRISSVRIITGLSCLFFGAAAWRLGPHSASDFSAQAQTVKPAVSSPAAQSPQLQTASVKLTSANVPEPKLVAAPGTEIYTAKRGEAIPTIAHRYISRTSYMTSTELAAAIRAANHGPTPRTS